MSAPFLLNGLGYLIYLIPPWTYSAVMLLIPRFVVSTHKGLFYFNCFALFGQPKVWTVRMLSGDITPLPLDPEARFVTQRCTRQRTKLV